MSIDRYREDWEDDHDAPQECDLDDDDDDAVVDCPNCGREVSELADRCPHCGDWIVHDAAAVSTGWKRGAFVALAAVVLLIVLLIWSR